jgi:hypothetical protein
MSCFLCERYRGKKIIHDSAAGCPYRAGAKCTRCLHRGHVSAECTALNPAHVRLPSTLEELIPVDARLRFNIVTHTPLVMPPELTDSMIDDINKVVIPDESDYKALGIFMKKHGIVVDEKVTKDTTKSRYAAIQRWGKAHGKRLVQQIHVECISTH